MIRQPLIAISGLAILLIAGALAGCDRQAGQTTTASSTPLQSESATADDKTPVARADEHDMNMKDDMNMQAGDELHANFAHKELVILEDVAKVPADFTKGLDAMYKQYLEMANALGSDDVQATDTAARRMRQTVESLEAAGLNAEAEEAWASHRKVIRTSLHQLTSAEDIEGKREHFSHISEAMYCALRSFGGHGKPVYVVFCPMAFGGHGGYWLADNREIANPYMGSKMAKCGEVRETIS